MKHTSIKVRTQPRGDGRGTIMIASDLHREIKTAASARGQSIAELVEESWTAFKAAQGKRLHKPVEAQSDAA